MLTVENPDLISKVALCANSGVLDMRPYARGRGAVIHVADLANHKRVIVKESISQESGLELEAWMLRYLRQHADIPLPEVIWADHDLLVLEWLDDVGRVTEDAEIDIARHIAKLHMVQGVRYGFERDTRIGSLRQPNPGSSDWIGFFRDQRLLYMARQALENKAIDMKMMRGIENIASRLTEWMIEPLAPTLIHGDLWGGNILTARGRVTGFIDPAIYYADPEIELAFITLFGTVGMPFFDAYAETHPIRDGFFEVRRDIYNLYPLLVHARLHGEMYLGNIQDILRRFSSV